MTATTIAGLADYHNEAAGAQLAGRYLTNEVIDGKVLGEWREKMRVSPHFLVGTPTPPWERATTAALHWAAA